MKGVSVSFASRRLAIVRVPEQLIAPCDERCGVAVPRRLEHAVGVPHRPRILRGVRHHGDESEPSPVKHSSLLSGQERSRVGGVRRRMVGSVFWRVAVASRDESHNGVHPCHRRRLLRTHVFRAYVCIMATDRGLRFCLACTCTCEGAYGSFSG